MNRRSPIRAHKPLETLGEEPGPAAEDGHGPVSVEELGRRASSPQVVPLGRAARASARVIPHDPTEDPRSADVDALRLLGLSAREARLLLALVPHPLSARKASTAAGLHRATGYRILRRLIDRGMVLGDGDRPQGFRSVPLSTLFRRLELFYRDEAEIPGLLGQVFHSGTEVFAPGTSGLPRSPGPVVQSAHATLRELSEAKQSLTAVVQPLSTPASFRNALTRALGELARKGVQVRMITDATPADVRFREAASRNPNELPGALHVRHLSPLFGQFFSIDRQRVIRLPSVGTSRRAPIGILLRDPLHVRHYAVRFEGLWTEAVGSNGGPRSVEHRAVHERLDGSGPPPEAPRREAAKSLPSE